MTSLEHKGYLTTRDKVILVIAVVVAIPLVTFGWRYFGLGAFFGRKKPRGWRIGRFRIGHLRKKPDTIDVTACSLDLPDALVPEDHVWSDRMLPWLRLSDGLPRYKLGRNDA